MKGVCMEKCIEDVFERISGVSQRINTNLANKYGVDVDKILYKENFIISSSLYNIS